MTETQEDIAAMTEGREREEGPKLGSHDSEPVVVSTEGGKSLSVSPDLLSRDELLQLFLDLSPISSGKAQPFSLASLPSCICISVLTPSMYVRGYTPCANDFS